MKKAFILLGSFLSMFIIFTSKQYYDQKVKKTALMAKEVLIEQTMIEKELDEQNRQQLLTKNMDKSVANLVNTAIEQNKQVNIVIVSSALSEVNTADSWPEIFQAQLKAHDLNDLLSVEMVMFSEKSSFEFIHEQQYNLIIEKQPHILIIEPFLLNDNGIARIEETLANFEIVINEIKKIYNELIVIVQPPHPLFDEVYYVNQVEALKADAKEKGYLYLDHWKNWPNNGNDYLEGKMPNQNGHEIWAEFLIRYFIAIE
jgi:hypothetical protein